MKSQIAQYKNGIHKTQKQNPIKRDIIFKPIDKIKQIVAGKQHFLFHIEMKEGNKK